MVTLQTNTATQAMYVTPFQRKKDFSGQTFSSYLLQIESLQTDKKYYAIFQSGNGTLQQDNERYSEFQISTNSDASTSGSVLITESGQYSYIIYGQSSTTNIDPLNAAVWGELERGLMTFAGEDAWSLPSITIPDNVVYYE
jgi:hypothetical protein